MIIGYFTERPYRWVPEDVIIRNKAYFAVPNTYFDHVRGGRRLQLLPRRVRLRRGARLRRRRPQRAPRQPVLHGQRDERRGGDPRPHHQAGEDHPDRQPAAGHQAPAAHGRGAGHHRPDLPGRLVTGWVRGAGSEQFFNNANPAYNREMFEEAHDFIIQAWTRPGPWRYEGKHFHYRHVNPWVLPYQKPHPPMLIPGVLSPETVRWCAERGYPYIGLGTALGPDRRPVGHLRRRRRRERLPGRAGELRLPDPHVRGRHRGEGPGAGQGLHLRRRPERFHGPSTPCRPVTTRRTPSGAWPTRRAAPSWVGVSSDRLKQAQEGKSATDSKDYNEVRRKLMSAYDKAQKDYLMIVGSPKTVIERVKTIMRLLRVSILTVFQVQGTVSNEDRKNSMRLFAQEVAPAIKEYAKELDLPDPFERFPGSVKLQAGVARVPVVDRTPLASLKMGV